VSQGWEKKGAGREARSRSQSRRVDWQARERKTGKVGGKHSIIMISPKKKEAELPFINNIELLGRS